jgi:hypothetical protein
MAPTSRSRKKSLTSNHLQELILIKFSLKDKVIEIFVFLGLLEWENTLDDNEKNNTGGEHIDLFTIVSLTFLDLWSHVGHGSSIGVQFVDLLVGGETEISDFEIHAVVNQNIFKFQVSVYHSFSLHVSHDLNITNDRRLGFLTRTHGVRRGLAVLCD